MTRRLFPTLCLIATLLLGACRSDGGIGRADSERALAWNASVVATHYRGNVEATSSNVERLGNWFSGELDAPWEGMRQTWVLYSEGERPIHSR